jgi:hypothetical protein
MPTFSAVRSAEPLSVPARAVSSTCARAVPSVGPTLDAPGNVASAAGPRSSCASPVPSQAQLPPPVTGTPTTRAWS